MRRIISWVIVLAINTVSVCIAQEEMPGGPNENNKEQKKPKYVPKDRIISSEYKVSEERIAKIREIVQKYYDNHANLESEDTMSDMQSEIKKFVPLVPAKQPDTRSLEEIQKSLAGKVNGKYGVTPEQIRKNTQLEAEKKYPMAKRNDVVKVYYKRGRSILTVSGHYYGFGLGGKSVRLNSRSIPLFGLMPESKSLFDQKFNAEMKKKYVDEKILEYMKNRQKYADALFAAEYAKIRSSNEKLGYIYQGTKWVSAEKVLKDMMPEMIKKAKERAEKERLEREAKEKAKREAQGNQNNGENNNDEQDEA